MVVNIVESVNNVLIMKSGKAKFLKAKEIRIQGSFGILFKLETGMVSK